MSKRINYYVKSRTYDGQVDIWNCKNLRQCRLTVNNLSPNFKCQIYKETIISKTEKIKYTKPRVLSI